MNKIIVKRLLILGFLVLLINSNVVSQSLVINELMASNAVSILDEDGDDSDWIELFNSTPNAIQLAGYGLSDDPEIPFKWIMPTQTIQAGAYLLVWASGKNRRVPNQPLHTNFSISSEGEALLLTDPFGQNVDIVNAVALQTDISYGRLGNQIETWGYFSPSSPGQPNASSAYSLLLWPPNASHASGYFVQNFDLSLNTTTEGATIVYTTNGSIPTANSPVYTSAISIHSRVGEPNYISLIPTNNIESSGPPYYEGWQAPLGEVYKINVIRTRLIHPDAPPGLVSTLTYIIDPELNNRYSIPVFSLATNNENLFNNEIGIYVNGNHTNYFQDGEEWEREANISLFEQDASLAFTQDIGIRTHGNTSRSRPRKSLRMISRGEYGNSWFNYQLFPDKSTAIYKRFILRNAGNDWDFSIIRDAMLQYLARNMKVERQYYRPSIFFINGEYWGIHNVRDRYDEHYIFAKYGIEEMEMTILENNSSFKFGNPSGKNHYTNLRSYVNSYDLTNDTYFKIVSTKMDVESFADFQIANIFAMNTDWPGNNTLFWRYYRSDYDSNALNGRDGLWRWMLLDMDFGFGLNFFYVPGVNQGVGHNTLAFALDANGPQWPNPAWSTFLLRKLLTNEQYKYYFINRFCDLLNTDFKEANVIAVIDSIEMALLPEMQEHINRWRRPVSISSWQQELQLMKSFAQLRPNYMRQYIQSQFNLTGPAAVTINNSNPLMGDIQVNSIVIPSVIYWNGIYFKQVPIQLKAIPKPGFRFVKWSGSVNSVSQSISFTSVETSLITAHFEPSNDFQGDSLNPVAYRLANGAYHFTYWDENNPEGQFPPFMKFQQSEKNDPLLGDEMSAPYSIPPGEYHSDDAASIGFPYRLTRRTRLNGLGNEGISFINTGRERDLGAAVLAIDTRGLEDITVSWKAGTLLPNSRAYAIRLQYRTNLENSFTDVLDEDGNLVEYQRNTQANHEMQMPKIVLPADANDKAYVQLRWKYYYTGQQIDPNSGSRDQLRLDDIEVSTVTMGVKEIDAATMLEWKVYPNPASDRIVVSFEITKPDEVQLEVLNSSGVKVAENNQFYTYPDQYQIEFDTRILKPGLYLIRLNTSTESSAKKFLITHRN